MSDTSVDVAYEQINQEEVRTESPAEESETLAEDEEDDEQCGFCIFMKGGGCKKEFVAWSECVDRGREGDEDFVMKCQEQVWRSVPSQT
eukprot:jgi/Botrbrau1/4870/Bobra.0032s0026.1